MAAEAGELPAVANRASQLLRLARVRVQKVGGMEGGLQGLVSAVAGFATVGRFDLVVADQAIRHMGEMLLRCATNGSGLLDAVMAGGAGVLRVKRRGGLAEIRLGLDGGLDHRREVRELRMKGVIEEAHTQFARLFYGYLSWFVTGRAYVRRGQQIVFHVRAGCGLPMTRSAIRLQLQMERMREIRRMGRNRQTGKRNQPL